MKFENLTQAAYTKVYQLALKLSGNTADAEDLTQEAFHRAYRSFDKYQGDRPFENWILRIVQRLFFDLLRNRRRRVKTQSYNVPLNTRDGDADLYFDIADNSSNPETVLLNSEVGEELQAALSGLTPDQIELVAMADVAERPYKEIAERFNVPVGTIRSRLHRAHRTLRARMERWEAKHPGHMGNLRLLAL